ncbi:TetR family transcriptional regulator [Methylobacillus sp. Pita1]|uniref:TetR family transcriptional regulator n=1 Tax=Methylobacillus sp. Pita1 TaxID=3382642 RepID=UPI0038B62E58
MARRQTPQVSSRKQPKQARSNELVTTILQAAVQVLEKEGASRFTTARVAEKAGVSIGSLYQYFPNKAAILFRLQSDEWRQTLQMLRNILTDQTQSKLERLRALVHAFIRSELEEAKMRGALDDAAPLYRDAPEAREAHAEGARVYQDFFDEILSEHPAETRALVCDIISTTLSTVGKEFSSIPRTSAEMERYAEALADMFCAYINSLST